MKQIFGLLSVFLMSASFLAAEPVKTACHCVNCACTKDKHCGCFSDAGCNCSAQDPNTVSNKVCGCSLVKSKIVE